MLLLATSCENWLDVKPKAEIKWDVMFETEQGFKDALIGCYYNLADESVYGPPAPGSKVGDFIQTWLMGSWNCGVFTHREIAQRLMDTFTGLKIKELAWFENPREKTLKNGKPRARRAKWLPDREVDLVYLYSDRYLDARNPSPAETDFFTVTRMDAWGVSTWFMCTPEAAGKLIAMDYDNLAVQETTIVG